MKLTESIAQWIGRLSESRPEFGGSAPCPFAATAGFTCIACADLAGALAVIRGTHRLAQRSVLILELPKHLSRDTHQFVAGLKDELSGRDLVAMVSDPQRPVVVDGYQTTQESHLLIIVQRLQEMERSSALLARLGYYERWDAATREMVR